MIEQRDTTDMVPMTLASFSLRRARAVWPGCLLALVLLSAFQGVAWAAGAALSHALTRHCKVPGPLAFGAGVLLAISLPTGRKLTTTCVSVSRRMPVMSAVVPGAYRLFANLLAHGRAPKQ